MENNRKDDSQKKEEVRINVNLGAGHYQPPSQSTASILASIKPLPPGILSGKKQEKKKEEKKVKRPSSLDLYNMGNLPLTPPIRPKKKDKSKENKEEGGGEKKQQLIPLQMATSISGQSLMYNQPVLTKPSQFQATNQEQPKKSPAQSSQPRSEKQTSGTSSSLGLLKYISASVKCRRLIYKQENFLKLINDTEDYLNDPDDADLGNEVRETLKNYKDILSTEIIKLKEKGLPEEASQDDFKEAKHILIGAIKGFKESVEDLRGAVEEEDFEMFEDGKETIENSFEEMELYFEIREKIKERLTG